MLLRERMNQRGHGILAYHATSRVLVVMRNALLVWLCLAPAVLLLGCGSYYSYYLFSYRNAAWAGVVARSPPRDEFQDDNPSGRATTTGGGLRFVWHVGPMKTGTTTLQLALREWSDTLLQDDSWIYLGPSSFMTSRSSSSNKSISHSHSNNSSNIVRVGNLKAPDFPERFRQLLWDYQDRNLNVIVSSEYFSIEYRSDDYRAVKNAWTSSTAEKLLDYDVQIVLGYRPYYEWIPSRYSQAHKYTPQQRRPHHKDRRQRRREGAGSDAYPWKDLRGHWKHPVQPMFPNYYERIDGSERIFTDHVYEFVAPHFSNITILSLQQPHQQQPNCYNTEDSDLIQRMFCDIVQATNTCQKYKQQQKRHQQNASVPVANPSRLSSIRSDAIAMGAAAKGIIDIQQYSRKDVMDAIERHIATTTWTRDNGTVAVHNLYLVCPTQAVLERLWKQTISKEAQLFGSTTNIDRHSGSWVLSPERKTQLRHGFQQYIDNQIFCHVNVTAVLGDPDWYRFLAPFRSAGE